MSLATGAIQDESRDGEFVLVHVVEGQRVATARASGATLEQMAAQLGAQRADVERELRSALERLHATELEKVTISRMREEPAGSGKFVASYVFHDFRDVSEAMVWYSVPDGTTGPDDVPVLVRNMLRYEVHSRLVGESQAAQDFLKVVR